jgi:hypothetical protein
VTIRQIALKLSLPYEAVYSALDSVKKMPRMAKKKCKPVRNQRGKYPSCMSIADFMREVQ